MAFTKSSGNKEGSKVYEPKTHSPLKDEKPVTPPLAPVTDKKDKEKEFATVNESILQSNHPACFANSLICFSLYPMKGQILHEIF